MNLLINALLFQTEESVEDGEERPRERNKTLSDDINWNRKTLRLAFSGNPYERYKSKV